MFASMGVADVSKTNHVEPQGETALEGIRVTKPHSGRGKRTNLPNTIAIRSRTYSIDRQGLRRPRSRLCPHRTRSGNHLHLLAGSPCTPPIRTSRLKSCAQSSRRHPDHSAHLLRNCSLMKSTSTSHWLECTSCKKLLVLRCSRRALPRGSCHTTSRGKVPAHHCCFHRRRP